MKRPFCVCIGAYFLVSFLTLTIGEGFFSVALPILSIALVLFVILCIVFRKSILGTLILVCLFSLMSLFKTNFVDLDKINSARLLHEKTVTVNGDVKTYNKSDKFVSFIVEDKSLGARVKVYAYDTDLDVDVGKRASFTGELTFDADSYNKGEATFLTSFTSDVSVYDSDNLLDKLIVALRSHVRRSASGSENNGLIKALIIGDKSDLPDEVTEKFKKLGTSHVLAISGLHLSIAVMSLYLFMVRLGASRRTASAISIVAAFLYMALTGFSASVVRAGQMMIIYLLTRMMRRVSDSITALFMAGFFIMLNSAWTLFSISFRLSFLSTFGILVFLPYVSRQLDKTKFLYIQKKGYPTLFTRLRFRLTDYVVISLYSTMAATIFTLPAVILSFNEISLISPLANLAIVFFVKYLLITAFLGSIFSFIPTLSAFMLLLSNLACTAMMSVADFLVSIAPDFYHVDLGFVGLGALMCTALILPSLFFSRKMLTLPITSVILIAAISIFGFIVDITTYDDVRVSAVWQRGCNSVFVTSRDKTYFFDMTATSSKNVSSIMSLLEKRSIRSVDEAVVVISTVLPEERINLILDTVKPEKLTLAIAGEIDADSYMLREKCRENNVELGYLYFFEHTFDDRVLYSCFPESCVTLEIQNEDNTMTFYKPFSSENITFRMLESDVVFFGSKKPHYIDAYEIGDPSVSFWRLTEKRIIRES